MKPQFFYNLFAIILFVFSFDWFFTSAYAVGEIGARVLTPFTGYATNNPCEQKNLKPDGVPWSQDDISGEGGTVSSAQMGQYEAMLRHTMQGLRLLYGPMTTEEEKSFNAFWAPFFDLPNALALDYFQKINPLLDEVAVTLANLDGTLSELGESLQEILITYEDPNSWDAFVGNPIYENVKNERSKLDSLVKQITALGNPPNPFTSQCAYRSRHKKAIIKKKEELNIFNTLKDTDAVLVRINFSDRRYAKVNFILPTRNTEWDSAYIERQTDSIELNGTSLDLASRPAGILDEWPRYRSDGLITFSDDGKSINQISFNGYKINKPLSPEKEPVETKIGSADIYDIPLSFVSISNDGFYFIYFTRAVKEHISETSILDTLPAGIPYDECDFIEIRVSKSHQSDGNILQRLKSINLQRRRFSSCISLEVLF